MARHFCESLLKAQFLLPIPQPFKFPFPSLNSTRPRPSSIPKFAFHPCPRSVRISHSMSIQMPIPKFSFHPSTSKFHSHFSFQNHNYTRFAFCLSTSQFHSQVCIPPMPQIHSYFPFHVHSNANSQVFILPTSQFHSYFPFHVHSNSNSYVFIPPISVPVPFLLLIPKPNYGFVFSPSTSQFHSYFPFPNLHSTHVPDTFLFPIPCPLKSPSFIPPIYVPIPFLFPIPCPFKFQFPSLHSTHLHPSSIPNSTDRLTDSSRSKKSSR